MAQDLDLEGRVRSGRRHRFVVPLPTATVRRLGQPVRYCTYTCVYTARMLVDRISLPQVRCCTNKSVIEVLHTLFSLRWVDDARRLSQSFPGRMASSGAIVGKGGLRVGRRGPALARLKVAWAFFLGTPGRQKCRVRMRRGYVYSSHPKCVTWRLPTQTGSPYLQWVSHCEL